LSFHIEKNIINFDENNALMMKMIITLEIILITSSKWLESTLKINQSMNELFIKSFINWIINKDENSWSYARRFYHKRLRMIQETSIIIQDMIWETINQSNEFLLWKRFSHILTKNILIIQSECITSFKYSFGTNFFKLFLINPSIVWFLLVESMSSIS